MKEGKPIWGIIGSAVVIIAVIGAVAFAIIHNKSSEEQPNTATFSLENNGGMPYEWQCKTMDNGIIEFGDVTTNEEEPYNDGGRIEEIHTVKAIKAGETFINCEYKKISEESNKRYNFRQFNVRVNKDLKIELTDVTVTIDED